jgi:hypothetical protein
MSANPHEKPRSPSQFFTVSGGAYVHENHADRHGHLPERSGSVQRQAGVAGLWLVFYAAIIGISFVASGAASRLFEMAAFAMK